jgi:FAD/FMN-containing dehydrogenase
VYYNQQFKRETKKLVHYNPFFYPLDSVGQWNRIYGKRGFMQYQFIIPFKDDDTAIRVILERIAKSGLGSFLVVFKTFGDIPSRGMMSFPREGINLAMDFPNNGPKTLKLLQELDQIVLESGGMEYAAKDSRMAASTFKQFYPQWQEFAQYVDPNFSSSFWRRVTGEDS